MFCIMILLQFGAAFSPFDVRRVHENEKKFQTRTESLPKNHFQLFEPGEKVSNSIYKL